MLLNARPLSLAHKYSIWLPYVATCQPVNLCFMSSVCECALPFSAPLFISLVQCTNTRTRNYTGPTLVPVVVGHVRIGALWLSLAFPSAFRGAHLVLDLVAEHPSVLSRRLEGALGD